MHITTLNSRHDKVVKLVSFFESVLIDGQLKKGKGENILKKSLLPKLVMQSDLEKARLTVSYFYRIRDKYLHHGVKDPIDFEKLNDFMQIAFRFVTFMVRVNATCTTWDQFYALLNAASK